MATDIRALASRLNLIPIIPITVAYLGYLAYDYYDYTSNPTSEYSMKIKDIESTKASIESLKKKRREQDQFYKNLEERKEKLRSISMTLADMKNLVSEEMDLPSLQKLILTEAQRAGLIVISWAPEPEIATENYVERPFQLEVKGLYSRFMIFLQRMANSSKIIRIEEFEMIASNRSQKYVELGVKMKLLAYRYNTSQADEIANKARDITPVIPPGTPPAGGTK